MEIVPALATEGDKLPGAVIYKVIGKGATEATAMNLRLGLRWIGSKEVEVSYPDYVQMPKTFELNGVSIVGRVDKNAL